MWPAFLCAYYTKCKLLQATKYTYFFPEYKSIQQYLITINDGKQLFEMWNLESDNISCHVLDNRKVNINQHRALISYHESHCNKYVGKQVPFTLFYQRKKNAYHLSHFMGHDNNPKQCWIYVCMITVLWNLSELVLRFLLSRPVTKIAYTYLALV